jgi:transposase
MTNGRGSDMMFSASLLIGPSQPMVAAAILVEPLLIVRRALREQIGVLHRRLLAVVREDEVCRRLMTTPGVGPVVALTYRATVDVPARFRRSKSVGAVFGLTPSRDQSGETDRPGAISRCGDAAMNTSSISGHYRRPLSPLMVQRVLQRDEALTRASAEALVDIARSYAVSHSTISRLAGFEVA